MGEVIWDSAPPTRYQEVVHLALFDDGRLGEIERCPRDSASIGKLLDGHVGN